MSVLMSLTSTFSFKNGSFFVNLLFWLFFLLVIFIRVAIFMKLNLVFTDTDQPFMWLGATDYSKGYFHEPRFYAQDYNTFFEALVAVPLIWMGVSSYKAVTIATHFLFLFPFLFPSFYLFYKRKKIQALIILGLLICESAEYDLLNSLPRGFVSGLFFTSFYILSLLNPYRLNLLAFNVVMAMIGYFVNPNSVLVSAPFIFYVFLHHYKNFGFYKKIVPLAFLLIPLYFLFDYFYQIHPDYIKHGIEYRISTAFFWDNIKNLDDRFIHIAYFYENNLPSVLLVLMVVLVFLIRHNKKAAWSFLIFISVILFSFCTGKTLEGFTWVYVSYSRMYLGIPVFISLFIALIQFKTNKWLITLSIIPLCFGIYKIVSVEKLVAPQHSTVPQIGVRLVKLEDALGSIQFYSEMCKKYEVPLLMVSKDFWLKSMLVYGGPSVDAFYPLTYEIKDDKRYWVRAGLKNKVFERFLLISEDFNIDKKIPGSKHYQIESVDGYGLVLVKNNDLTTFEFAQLVDAFEPRP